MKLIIFDFEVFAFDTLLGAKILDDTGFKLIQTWNLDEIRQFYQDNKTSIWIGHNNSGYDNFILQAIVQGRTESQIKALSDKIIRHNSRLYLDIPLNYYDLMDNHMVGLKTVECTVGKRISTSEVNFTLKRKLTEQEKLDTESYNRDDLAQTEEDFGYSKDEFALRIDVIKEFNLPLSALHVTGTQLAELVLHAEKIEGIENWIVKPQIYSTLQVKNQQVLDFYLNEMFRKGKNLTVDLCGVEHKLGAGGIHGARAQCHEDWAFYFDVSGYYNLVMINYDLLPRSIPEEYRAYYKYMYEEQLRLKKINPTKRWVYKIILLSVFGAMTNKYCKFYDPERGTLVTMTGQIFLVDLLEKLEGKVKLLQSNTDGIIAKPLPGISKEEIVSIIDEWQTRTGFVLKLETIYDIHQRDVNCYMYKTESGDIHVLGEAVKYYDAWENPFWENVYGSAEPVILHYAVVDYFINNALPEQTIEKYKRTLRMFQYVCKKGKYSYLEYRQNNIDNNETSENIGAVCRAFASNSSTSMGSLYKIAEDKGIMKKAKVPRTPDNVFVYNDEILSEQAINDLIDRIDYKYYIDRAYERIAEFIKFEKVKKFA